MPGYYGPRLSAPRLLRAISGKRRYTIILMGFGVFIHRSDSIYDDSPAERYQFPSQYLGRVDEFPSALGAQEEQAPFEFEQIRDRVNFINSRIVRDRVFDRFTRL